MSHLDFNEKNIFSKPVGSDSEDSDGELNSSVGSSVLEVGEVTDQGPVADNTRSKTRARQVLKDQTCKRLRQKQLMRDAKADREREELGKFNKKQKNKVRKTQSN